MSPVIDCAMLPALPDGFIDAVDALGRLEESDGSVAPARGFAGKVAGWRPSPPRLQASRGITVRPAYGDALERDFAAWCEAGLTQHAGLFRFPRRSARAG